MNTVRSTDRQRNFRAQKRQAKHHRRPKKPLPRHELSPLGEARARLHRGDGVREVMTQALGAELTGRVLEAGTRAMIGQISSDERRTARSGVQYAPPGSARAPMAPEPLRAEDSGMVRTLCQLVITLAEEIATAGNGVRVSTRALYHRALAARLGRDPREVERYMAILRTAEIANTWQPKPGSPGIPQSKAGRSYAVYALSVALPRTVLEQMRAWRAAFAARVTRKAAVPVEVAPTVRAPLSASAARLAAQLLGRHGPDPA